MGVGGFGADGQGAAPVRKGCGGGNSGIAVEKRAGKWEVFGPTS